jgi:thiol-disulfide isomerase/thioredoxin
LEGRPVRLSDFRGRPVIVNFWTTWCLSCLGEIPTLVELQKQQGDRLVVLGISLDAVPDNHGHAGESDHHAGSAGQDREQVRAQVTQMARKLAINYPVLLDERNAVGARFNGGELPTTLIFDSGGVLRRRFVGARDLAAFQAMLSDALKPARGL